MCTTAHKQNNVLLALTLRSLLFSRKSLLLLVHPHVLSIHHHHRRHFLVPYIQHLLFFIRRVSSYNLTYLTRVSHHYVTTTCPFPFFFLFDALCEGMLTYGRTNSTHGFTTKKAKQKTKKKLTGMTRTSLVIADNHLCGRYTYMYVYVVNITCYILNRAGLLQIGIHLYYTFYKYE